MPGSVANAVVSTVMPQWLCTQFERTDAWQNDLNVYRNGEVQARTRVANSRKQWIAAPVLTAAALATLKTFFTNTRHGAFFFYDPFDAAGAIGSNYDGTGASTTGRYRVRWDGDWQQTMNLGRFTVSLRLVEVA